MDVMNETLENVFSRKPVRGFSDCEISHRIMYEKCFANREISWLRFNERVLEEAEDDRTPLCERLSFLSIFQSNLDEFFRVRIGSLYDEMLADSEQRENKTHMTPGEQINAAVKRIHELCIRRDNNYKNLMDQLRNYGKTVIGIDTLSETDIGKLKKIFSKCILPYLSVFSIGNKQPFPFLKNGEIYAAVQLMNKQGKGKSAVIPCGSSVFPRLVSVPDKPGSYILSEEIILYFADMLFEGYSITEKVLFRLTRNADIDADSIYDEELNYRDHMSAVIKQRNMLAPVRMEVNMETGNGIIELLCRKVALSGEFVFTNHSPLNYLFIGQLCDELRSREELFYPRQYPQNSASVIPGVSVIRQIEKKDILLHYPYESIRPFLALLNEAAQDIRVNVIRMTLYRLARDSKVIEALIEAAENGKKVEVFVELKARFDEENNIEWSRRLEKAGCKVIYGIEHIKVHSKLCLIGYTDNGTEKWITQIGTGNYNEKTARFYTDFCLMTAHAKIAEEAKAVFDLLEEGVMTEHTDCLFVSPNCMRNHIIDCIDEEISKAHAGGNAMIRLKMNSLTDKELINKLIEASCSGVRIQLIVRGICCLIGGIQGCTENIEIISIVGRYLEHSRIYIFGQDKESKVYISSADFMTRNMNRRVEIACPVYDQDHIKKIVDAFELMWQDNRQARLQLPDGSYFRRMPQDKEISCQTELYETARSNTLPQN